MVQLDIQVSIVTINYNGLSDTCALIESIPIDEQIEIIVVDNASANDEASELERRFPHVVVVRSDENLGFAGGNNLGINAAHGKYLFFINNDTVFRWQEGAEKGISFFQPLIDRLESSEQIGVVCPKIRFAWDDCPIQFAGYTPLSTVTMRNHSIGFGEKDEGQYNTPHPTPYAHGAAMLVKRSAIKKAGTMPECYFLYYEELDWSMLFTRAGYQIWYDPCCTIYHKESQTTGQNSPLRTYYITRNRLLFAKRNFSVPKRWLTYSYLILLVSARDFLKYNLKKQSPSAKSVLLGITDFIKGKTGFKNLNRKTYEKK